MYLIYSTRHSGWATPTGQYTTEPKDALQFTHADALARCAKHKASGFTSFPVALKDLL